MATAMVSSGGKSVGLIDKGNLEGIAAQETHNIGPICSTSYFLHTSEREFCHRDHAAKKLMSGGPFLSSVSGIDSDA